MACPATVSLTLAVPGIGPAQSMAQAHRIAPALAAGNASLLAPDPYLDPHSRRSPGDDTGKTVPAPAAQAGRRPGHRCSGKLYLPAFGHRRSAGTGRKH